MNKQKRERSINFNKDEIKLLMKLIEKYKHIIENKKSDSHIWREKDNSWKSIEESFNSISGNTFRSGKTLKQKYEAIKRDSRKKGTFGKAETSSNSGSSNSAPQLVLTQERLKNLGLLPVDSLDDTMDSDSESNPLELVESVDDNELELDGQIEPAILSNNIEVHVEVESEVEEKVPQWRPKVLKSRRPPGMCKFRPRRPVEKVAEAKLEIIKLQKQILEEQLQYNRERREKEKKELLVRRERLEMAKVQLQKRWDFEEEEREHKRQMWVLEKQSKLKK